MTRRMSKRKAVAIVNPVARHGKGRELAQPALEILSETFDIDVVETTYNGHARELAYLVEDGVDIFAVGGDGTVHEVLNGMLDSKKKESALAPVPTGSGNDSARSLGFPLSPEAAAREIAKRRIRTIDVGLVNTHWYSNSLGLGMDARVAWEAVQLRRETSLKGVPLYLKALANIISEWETYPLTIEVAGHTFEANITLLAVNIGRSYGGGFFVTPHAYIDDGFFDCCLFEAIPAWQVWLRVPFLIPGRHEWMKKAHIFRTKELRVTCDREILVQLDGEVYPFKEGEMRLYENALKVYAGERGYFHEYASDDDPILPLAQFALAPFEARKRPE